MICLYCSGPVDVNGIRGSDGVGACTDCIDERAVAVMIGDIVDGRLKLRRTSIRRDSERRVELLPPEAASLKRSD